MKINIPALCLISAFLLTIVLFSESRNDPSLRIAALVSATGLVNTFTAIASTMLTGKDLTYTGAKPPSTTVTTDVPATTTTTTTDSATIQVSPKE